MAAYIMAHDLGTSSHKCSVFDTEGRLVATASTAYPTDFRNGGEAEQSPAVWWEAVTCTSRLVLEKVDASSVQAIAFSGHMMGIVPIAVDGEVLHPAIIHADYRSASLQATAFERMDEKQFYRMTGNRIDAHYPLLKLLWLREHRPEAFQRAAYFIQAKDYLVYQMTGRLGITDYSDASLTGMYGIRRGDWEDEILNVFSLPKNRLPEIFPSATIVGKVTSQAAEATGLIAGTPVVIGGGDGSCAALGAGAIRPGDAYIYLGTTAWVSSVSDEPFIDEAQRVFNMCGPSANSINVLGTMKAAGAAYEWAVRNYSAKEAADAEIKGISLYEEIESKIAQIPWGSNGLIFHPYLMGERAPLWDQSVRGLLFGLDITHSRFDMLRAVMEGVSYGLRSIAEVLEQPLGIERYTVIGGGMKSVTWRSVLASVLGKPIIVPAQTGEATSLGAAMSAGVAVGIYKDYEDAKSKMNRPFSEILPDAEGSKLYTQGYTLYKQLYQCLKNEYGTLKALKP